MPGFGFGHGFSRRQEFRAGPATVAEGLVIFGMTFTFAAARPVGQYANGDWWVLGPVSITAITPESEVISGTYSNATAYTGRVVHGTMVNPGNRSFATGGLVANNTGNTNQGYDSLPAPGGSWSTATQIPYTDSFNVDPGRTGSPLAVTTGSLVKSVSKLVLSGSANDAGRQYLDKQVVLTVVDSIPAAGAIRPGISRASKSSTMNIAQVDLARLGNFAPTASTPTYEAVLASVDGMFPAHWPANNTARNVTGANGQPEYGRDIGSVVHTAMLWLHLNVPAAQKRAIIAHLLALADDLLSRAVEGGATSDNGGGHSWKKPVLVFAAALLGDNAPAQLLEYCDAAQRNVWAEDTQIFRINELAIATPRSTALGRPRSPYTQQMLGSAEWADNLSLTLADSGSNWDAYYRDVAAGALIGGTVAVDLAGGRALWNNEAFWDYMDSAWHRRSEFGVGNGVPSFHNEFMIANRPVKTAVPALLDAGIKNDAIWLRYDQALNETATLPTTSDFVVNVNGSPVTVSSVSVWRQNVGLALAAAVSGNDTVTVSYTAGTNPVRSVDEVNIANLTAQALTNRTDKVGGPNAAYPVVQFAPGVRRQLLGGGYGATGSFGTIALLKFRFPARPSSSVLLIGNTSGAPGLRLALDAAGNLELLITNGAGTTIYRQFFGVIGVPGGYQPNTDYDILISLDMTRATSTAGATIVVNGQAVNPTATTWSGGAGVTAGWSRLGSTGTFLNFSNFTFSLGALWVDTTARLDLNNPANVAKFTSATSGDLDIGTLGDGISGAQPSHFAVGNADQWNAGSGINRGSGAGRWFVTEGAASLLSGAEWV